MTKCINHWNVIIILDQYSSFNLCPELHGTAKGSDGNTAVDEGERLHPAQVGLPDHGARGPVCHGPVRPQRRRPDHRSRYCLVRASAGQDNRAAWRFGHIWRCPGRGVAGTNCHVTWYVSLFFVLFFATFSFTLVFRGYSMSKNRLFCYNFLLPLFFIIFSFCGFSRNEYDVFWQLPFFWILIWIKNNRTGNFGVLFFYDCFLFFSIFCLSSLNILLFLVHFCVFSINISFKLMPFSPFTSSNPGEVRSKWQPRPMCNGDSKATFSSPIEAVRPPGRDCLSAGMSLWFCLQSHFLWVSVSWRNECCSFECTIQWFKDIYFKIQEPITYLQENIFF